MDLVEGIEWPFLISGLWCVLGGAGYLYLALTPLRMPVHKKQEEQEMGKEGVSRSDLSQPVLPLVCFMLFLYYTCSGAVERVFQSMATTWSLISKKLFICTLLENFFSSSTFQGRSVVHYLSRPPWPPSQTRSTAVGSCSDAWRAFLLPLASDRQPW